MRTWIMGLFAVAALSGSVSAQPDEAAMMEMMQQYGTPGPEHAFLSPLVGSWTWTSTMWMGPDSMESTGTSTYAWSHGGRFLTQAVTGNMMGASFTGTGIMGFDRYKSEVFSFWIDSMGTGFMTSRGTISEDGKTFSLEGTYDDYMTGVDNKWMKTVITVHDDDHNTLEMFEKGADGKDVRIFRIESNKADVDG